MIFWTISLILLSIYVLHKYLSRNFDYWKKRNVPFIRPKPFVGNFLDMCLVKYDIGTYFANLYRQCDAPFFGVFFFSKPVLIIRDPEIMKNILITDFSVFTDRNILIPHWDETIAHVLFVLRGKEWKTMRSKLSPFFSSAKLRNVFESMDIMASALQDNIEKNENKSLETKGLCCRYSTAVIVKSIFGIDSHSFENEKEEFRQISSMIFDFSIITCMKFTAYWFFHSIVKLTKIEFFHRQIIDFMREVIWDSIKLREEKNIKRNDLVDIIVQMKKDEEFCKSMNFYGDYITGLVFGFFEAGFETIASTISFALYELCLHPEKQAKLRDNIVDTIEKFEGNINYESVNSMKYLGLVVKETLRKYPALPFLDRLCNSDYKIPGTDFTVEKGMTVVIPVLGVHTDPNIYNDPDDFIPERFEDDKRDCSFLSLGKGPRACIGERFGVLGAKVALVRILTKFEIQRSEDTPVPIKFEPKSFVLAPTVGLFLKFKKLS